MPCRFDAPADACLPAQIAPPARVRHAPMLMMFSEHAAPIFRVRRDTLIFVQRRYADIADARAHAANRAKIMMSAPDAVARAFSR